MPELRRTMPNREQPSSPAILPSFSDRTAHAASDDWRRTAAPTSRVALAAGASIKRNDQPPTPEMPHHLRIDCRSEARKTEMEKIDESDRKTQNKSQREDERKT
nr:hypothetical protein Itr_chr13CG11730 [Ipomoea trifida]